MKEIKCSFKDELELTRIIEENPNSIEEGLKIIKTFFKLPNKKTIDAVGIDAENRLVILEIKTGSDDWQLNQAMEYYDWALENLDTIKNTYKTHNIGDLNPKIILIAENFSEKLILLAKYLSQTINIKLYRYVCVKCNDRKSIACIEEEIPDVPQIFNLNTEDSILAYISDPIVNSRVKRLINFIKRLNQDITVEPKGWFGFSIKYKGRVFGSITPRKSYIRYWNKKDQQKDEWEEFRIVKTGSQFSKLKRVIKISFVEVKNYMEEE